MARAAAATLVSEILGMTIMHDGAKREVGSCVPNILRHPWLSYLDIYMKRSKLCLVYITCRGGWGKSMRDFLCF